MLVQAKRPTIACAIVILAMVVFATLCPLAQAQAAGGAVHVDGYTRKNGTYVRPHNRSAPDGRVDNNWSTKGNINPYTGEAGTKQLPPSSTVYRAPSVPPAPPSEIVGGPAPPPYFVAPADRNAQAYPFPEFAPAVPEGTTGGEPARQVYDETREPGYHQHDGFFLQFRFGGGYQSLSRSTDSQKLFGAALAIDLAIGFTVAPNLILYAEVDGYVIPTPEFEANGASVTLQKTTAEVDTYGLGLIYYTKPSNYFVSGMAGLSVLDITASEPSPVTSSRIGFGTTWTVGKEWWVSHDWGLGLAGQFSMSMLPTKDETDKGWTALAIAVQVSATYN